MITIILSDSLAKEQLAEFFKPEGKKQYWGRLIALH